MISDDPASDAAHAVLECQQQFWLALQHKDAERFAQVLAADFVCRSPGEPDQQRTAFIATITNMPLTVVSVTAEQIAIQLFDKLAVLTGTQVAHMLLPNGEQLSERLALTNVFRQTAGQWQMALAHPVALPNQ
jgi:uncharacterized protein (TIGR02246 family)